MTLQPGPSSSHRPALSRRAFLKLGFTGAGALALPLLAHSRGGRGAAALGQLAAHPLGEPFAAGGLRVASALRLPMPHVYFVDSEALLSRPSGEFDLLLVPAYVAASLIRRGMLQTLAGPLGRAHDPEGAYTVPYAHRIATLNYSDGWPVTAAPSWTDLWHAEARAPWPASARLAIGVALLRRGHSPNDTHPGHLAQAEQDLMRLRPQIVAGPMSQPNLSFSLAALDQPGAARLPIEGVPLLEYDWAIPAGAAGTATARDFLRQMAISRVVEPLPAGWTVPLIPLMPLPDVARAQHAQIWSALMAQRSPAAA